MSKASPRRTPPQAGFSILGVILLLGSAGGCGGGDPLNRQAVSGVVTLDGRPLDQGAILLEPIAESGGGLAVGATIRRGEFSIPREQGPDPGTYRVRVYASAGVETPPGPGQTERTRRPMVERIPEIYNTKSDWQFRVIDGGRNRLRWDLSSRGGS